MSFSLPSIIAVVDNKPVGVDTISIKKTARAVPALKKKYHGSPTSFLRLKYAQKRLAS